MLKTVVGDEVWLISQPDHARVAGYLAAHWGGAGRFSQPGKFAPAGSPGSLRREVVRAVAEHDNGWWEWEASPAFDPADGLPLGLAEVARRFPEAGLGRWLLGVPRLAGRHPYAALLVSLHAYHLYAFAFGDEFASDDAFRHPLFGGSDLANAFAADRDRTHQFLVERRADQEVLAARVAADPELADALRPEHLHPHARLVQVLDALSLMLCFGGNRPHDLADVPRASWSDRVTLAWRPGPGRRVACDPYPFDIDPLPVHLPARVLTPGPPPAEDPLVRLHAEPLQSVRFELTAG